jgi:hypothetical protein
VSFWPLLLSFAPWIVLKIIVHLPLADPLTMLRAAVVAATLACLWQVKTDKTRSILLWGSCAFFAFVFVFVVLRPNAWVIRNMGLLSQAILCLITFGSLLVGRPFTMAYAKLHVPRELWDSPRFLRKNQIITGAWGGYFLFCLILVLMELHRIRIGAVTMEILSDAAMVGVMLFTARMSKRPNAPRTEPAE